MAAAQRKADESFIRYRERLDTEQARMNRVAQGNAVFAQTNLQLMEDGNGVRTFKKVGPGATAHAVRDGKLNRKSGRRLATAYT